MRRAFPFILILLSSCTTYQVRNACDKTDWYAYGKKAAQEGRRLSGDAQVKKCEDAGSDVDAVALDHGFKEGMANYCQPDQVYIAGKKGEFFNDDMCGETSLLKSRHASGVREFCAKSNAFSVGASGRDYNGICPHDLEAAFLPEFNRGRKNYLQATIAANESELGDLEVRIGQLESRKFRVNSQLNGLPSSSAYASTAANGVRYPQAPAEDPAILSRRNDLEVQMQDVDSDLFHARERQTTLQKKNRDMQVEMTAL